MRRLLLPITRWVLGYGCGCVDVGILFAGVAVRIMLLNPIITPSEISLQIQEAVQAGLKAIVLDSTNRDNGTGGNQLSMNRGGHKRVQALMCRLLGSTEGLHEVFRQVLFILFFWSYSLFYQSFLAAVTSCCRFLPLPKHQLLTHSWQEWQKMAPSSRQQRAYCDWW